MRGLLILEKVAEGMAEIRLENTQKILAGFYIFQAVHLIGKYQNTLTGLQDKILLFDGDGGGSA